MSRCTLWRIMWDFQHKTWVGQIKLISKWLHLLLVQWYSSPHWPHRVGDSSPHWHPPLTQHAQTFDSSSSRRLLSRLSTVLFSKTKDAEYNVWLLLLFCCVFQRHGHPVDFLVHKSTWPFCTRAHVYRRKGQRQKNKWIK